MEAERSLMLAVLSELMDSDDEKPTREKARSWIKGRTVSGYFNNIIPELEMFRMSVEDFEFILKHIDDTRPFENVQTLDWSWMKTSFKPIQPANYVG